MEANKQLVRRFLNEAWNLRNMLIVDELLSPAFCRHIANAPYLLSLEGQRNWILNVQHAFPDLALTVKEVIAEGDTVVFRGLLRGTHILRFRNIEPTHKQISVMVIGILRLEDGLIVEQWGGVSEPDIYQELLLPQLALLA